MLNASGIYQIVNLANGKQYIGSAKNFRLRWKAHLQRLRLGRHHSRHLQAAWTKHGEAAFAFRPLKLCPVADLVREEQAAFDAFRPEYNICPQAGSALGVKHTAATKAKLSAAKIGNRATRGYRHTPEACANIARGKLGNTHTRGKRRNPAAVLATAKAHRGMKRSAETRARISAAMTGKKRPARSAEHSAKLSAAQKGRPRSPASIEKMRRTKTGMTLTPAHRAAIGEASKAAWARRRASAPKESLSP